MPWNPADKAAPITLSLSDTRADHDGAGRSIACVRGSVGISSGKWYYEVTSSDFNPSGDDDAVGLANTTHSLTARPGLPDADAIGVFTAGATYYANAYQGFVIGAFYTSGKVIGIAVDRTANLFWASVITSGTRGNWNGDGAANPATGTNGLDISALTGTLYPIVYMEDPASGCVANFGLSAYAATAPAGFASLDSVAGRTTKNTRPFPLGLRLGMARGIGGW